MQLTYLSCSEFSSCMCIISVFVDVDRLPTHREVVFRAGRCNRDPRNGSPRDAMCSVAITNKPCNLNLELQRIPTKGLDYGDR